MISIPLWHPLTHVTKWLGGLGIWLCLVFVGFVSYCEFTKHKKKKRKERKESRRKLQSIGQIPVKLLGMGFFPSHLFEFYN